eukprot:2930457-Lingulodinium_polyedra.AAC.1
MHRCGPDNSAHGAHVRPSQNCAGWGGGQQACHAVNESEAPTSSNAHWTATNPVARPLSWAET